MENKELNELLSTLGYPVAYQAFKEGEDISTPYIVFIQSGSDNFGADNKVYEKYNRYNIELYTSDKDFGLEEKIENLLDENEIYWEKSGDIRIEEEAITEVIYYI